MNQIKVKAVSRKLKVKWSIESAQDLYYDFGVVREILNLIKKGDLEELFKHYSFEQIVEIAGWAPEVAKALAKPMK